MTIHNAKRDGVRVHTAALGSQQAGSIRPVESPGTAVKFGDRRVPVRYELELDGKASEESRYASLVHELGHLYCGHLGTPNPRWWPDRRGLSERVMEFEAESVSYLVCGRAGIDTPSEKYLAGYLKDQPSIPPISLDCVMKAAGLIESMGLGALRPREKNKQA